MGSNCHAPVPLAIFLNGDSGGPLDLHSRTDQRRHWLCCFTVPLQECDTAVGGEGMRCSRVSMPTSAHPDVSLSQRHMLHRPTWWPSSQMCS